jgi:hypothetical protein
MGNPNRIIISHVPVDVSHILIVPSKELEINILIL